MNGLGKRRVLLVEDNADDVQLIIEALAPYRDAVDFDVAGDGEEALEYLHRLGRYASREPVAPCLVVLDIKMPKVDGIEVLKAMKSNLRTSSIPVVIFTSSRESRDLVECYRSGANAYVVKSIGFSEFTTAMEGIGTFWLKINELPPLSLGAG